jgi:hypothetical protein
MFPNRFLSSLSAIFVILCGPVLCQTVPSITQDAKNSSCSNIVALVGSVSLDCSSLTPEQQKLIESIPALLRKMLAEQLDPKLVMEKLDEIKKGVDEIRRNGSVPPARVGFVAEEQNRKAKLEDGPGATSTENTFWTEYQVVIDSKFQIPQLVIRVTGPFVRAINCNQVLAPSMMRLGGNIEPVSGLATCTMFNVWQREATVRVATYFPSPLIHLDFECPGSECIPLEQ